MANLPMLTPFINEEGLTEILRYDKMWKFNLIVVYGIEDESQLTEWGINRLGVDNLKMNKNAAASHFRVITCYDMGREPVEVICLNRGNEDMSRIENTCFLMHECLHVTCAILKDKGVRMCYDSEECYAYLQESLVNDIWEAMLKAPKDFRAKDRKVKQNNKAKP